jgi:hypothetical protein
MVRLSDTSHRLLKDLAERSGESLQGVLERIIDESRQRRMLEEFSEDYARLRADPQAWAELLEERRPWENTLMDGIEPE